MKKIFSIILVMAMLAMPVTVFAAGTGASDDPYLLSNEDTDPITITIPAESDVWVKVNNANSSVVNVSNASSQSYFLWYCRQTYNSATSLTMVPGVDMFSVTNTSTSALTLSLKLTGGAADPKGTFEYPETIELAENVYTGALSAYLTTELEAGSSEYYYSVVAPFNGCFSITVSAYDNEYNDIGWMFTANNITKGKYGNTNHSDDNPVIDAEIVPVSTGDEVIILANTYDPASPWNAPAGNIGVSISFEPVGSSLFPENVVTGTHTFTGNEGSIGYYYRWTATESGSVTFTMLSETNWQYLINGARANGQYFYGYTHWCDESPAVVSETHVVDAGDVLNIWVNTYDPVSGYLIPEGTVEWSLSFVPGEGNGNGNGDGDDIIDEEEDLEENYYLSELFLEEGTKTYPLSGMYPYTVFAFEPTKTGRYTFSATNALIGLVSTNGMWITVGESTSAITDGTVTPDAFDWLCSAVGQSIWVAVSGESAEADITVGYEEVEIKQIPREYYENKQKPESFVFGGDPDTLEYVDTFDGVTDYAVLGTDGFYHLNTADGPILFANLGDTLLSLEKANSYGQLKQLIYEDGEVVLMIDYTLAMIEYLEAMDQDTKLYPLTDDLIEVFYKAGTSLGWYGEGGWIGGNEDDAWMFACYYNESIKDTEDILNNGGSLGDLVGSGAPTSPETGDSAIVIAIIAIASLTGAAVLVIKKRRFN